MALPPDSATTEELLKQQDYARKKMEIEKLTSELKAMATQHGVPEGAPWPKSVVSTATEIQAKMAQIDRQRMDSYYRSNFNHSYVGVDPAAHPDKYRGRRRPQLHVTEDHYHDRIKFEYDGVGLEIPYWEFLDMKQNVHSQQELEALIIRLIADRANLPRPKPPYYRMEFPPDPRAKPKYDDKADAWSYMTFDDFKFIPSEDNVGKSKRKTKPKPGKESWQDRQNQQKEARDKMSNKFLPFIVEKSSPLNIFQTLISRSKGMNTAVIASIFHIVVQRGIAEVRDVVKTLPDLPVDKLYTEIINKYPALQVQSSDLELFMSVKPYITEDDRQKTHEKLQDYDKQDFLIFIMVLAMVSDELLMEYSNIRFDDLLNEHQRVLDNIGQYVAFSDGGVEVLFNDADDLKGYILYNALLSDAPKNDPICAKFKKKAGGK